MDDETLFGWVHISDIHFGHGDAGHGWDQALVMGELRRDIASKPTPVRVDAIFVTGDIAFSGAGRSDKEYDLARAWLLEAGEAAGVKPERTFLVPGNHDVNRNVDSKSKSTGRLIKALRSRGTPDQALDDALKDPEDRKLLASRMEKYLDFAKDFGPWAGQSPLPLPDARLYWVHTIEQHGLRVRLVGLNTALLCKDDEDPGQLRLGNEQVARALAADRAQNEAILVLSHHPLRKGWLGDEGSADKWIRNHAQVHLSGHVHEAESEEARSGSGQSFVRVTAGAAHNDQLPAWIPQTHGYSFGQIRRGNGDGGALRVYPRLWSPPNASFVLDVHTVPRKNVQAGKEFAEHELPLVLPATTRPDPGPPPAPPRPSPSPVTPQPGPLPAGPLPTFISYAAADQKALDRLRVHLTQLGPKRNGFIDAWSVAQVGSGEDARAAAAERLRSARIILLLISPDYVGSEECYDVEMVAAVARHDRGEARVIPVLLQECDYHAAPFAHLKFALQPHPDAAPAAVHGVGDPETAFKRVSDDVRNAVIALRERAGVA